MDIKHGRVNRGGMLAAVLISIAGLWNPSAYAFTTSTNVIAFGGFGVWGACSMTREGWEDLAIVFMAVDDCNLETPDERLLEGGPSGQSYDGTVSSDTPVSPPYCGSYQGIATYHFNWVG